MPPTRRDDGLLLDMHGAILLEVVWRTVQQDIPALGDQLRRIVPKEVP